MTFSLFIAAVVLYTLNTSSLRTSHNQEVNDIHYKRAVLHKQKTNHTTDVASQKKVYESSTGNFINYHTQTALKELRAVFCTNRLRVR